MHQIKPSITCRCKENVNGLRKTGNRSLEFEANVSKWPSGGKPVPGRTTNGGNYFNCLLRVLSATRLQACANNNRMYKHHCEYRFRGYANIATFIETYRIEASLPMSRHLGGWPRARCQSFNLSLVPAQATINTIRRLFGFIGVWLDCTSLFASPRGPEMFSPKPLPLRSGARCRP